MISLKNMEPRERNMVMAAVFFVAVTILWVGVYEPLAGRRASMKKKIEAKTAEIAEARALSAKLTALRAGFSALDTSVRKRPAGSTPASDIEGIAQMTGMKENITAMNPQQPQTIGSVKETQLDMTLDKVTLPKLVRFAEAVRNAEGALRVKRISVKPQFKDPALLDVSVTIAGYEVAQ